MKTGSWGENYTNIIRFNTIESELNSYLCSKLDEQREKIRQIANDKANDVGINGMVISDLLYTSVCNIENTFRSNLDNLLAVFCNNTHSGYLYFYDLMFMSKICKEESNSKKQAFAFICEKNLKEEFKLFCNNEGSEY